MPDVTALPRPGDVFAGKYLIERVIGSGRNSLVFVALHGVTGKRFAIEWLVPKGEHARHDAVIDEDDPEHTPVAVSGSGVEAADIRDAANLVSEADDIDTSEQQVVGHFRHPNVLEVYDVGEASGSLYTVMEWGDGESLEARIARTGPMPIVEASELLVPCMRGMHEAHASGILHRDLKPSNIFLCQATRAGEIVAKVLDFELASTNGGSGDASSIALWRGAKDSKPYYRAPEQLGGLEVDHRADVYAFGAILYEALTGRPPFAPVRYAKRDERATHGVPALQSRSERLPPGADAIIGRAMARDVARRFQTLHEFADAFEAFARSPLAFSQSTISGPPPFDGESMRRGASPAPKAPVVFEGSEAGTDPGAFTHEISFTRNRPWPRPTASEQNDEPSVPESAWQAAPDWNDHQRTSHVPEWSEAPTPSSRELRSDATPHVPFYPEAMYEARGAANAYPPHVHGYGAGARPPAFGIRVSGATLLLAAGAFCFVGLVGFMAFEEWSSRRGDYLQTTDLAQPENLPETAIELPLPAPSFEARIPRGIAPPEEEALRALPRGRENPEHEITDDPLDRPDPALNGSTDVAEGPKPLRLGRAPGETSWNAARAPKVASPRGYAKQPYARTGEGEPRMETPRPQQPALSRSRASSPRDARGTSPAPSRAPSRAVVGSSDQLPMELM